MPRNQLIDPETGETYVWQVNDSEVEAAVKTRTIGHLQPTAAGWETVRPIRQQGESGPNIRRFRGMVAQRAQHEVFLRFYQICQAHTVHLILYTGERLEVIIRSYEPGRKRLIRGPHGARWYVWRYTMEIEIVTQISP